MENKKSIKTNKSELKKCVKCDKDISFQKNPDWHWCFRCFTDWELNKHQKIQKKEPKKEAVFIDYFLEDDDDT